MSIVKRARDNTTDACALCGVPVGVGCRSMISGASFTSLSHDVILQVADTEKELVAAEHQMYERAQNLVMRMPKRARKSTADATPLILLNESLPVENGAVAYVEIFVLARSAAQFRAWRRAALLERVAGAWAVLGGVADLPTPAPSAGASTWAVTPSLPGTDTIRISVTGQAALPIWWVVLLDLVIL